LAELVRQAVAQAGMAARVYGAMVKGFPKNPRLAKTSLAYGAITLVRFVVGEDVDYGPFVVAVVSAMGAGEISDRTVHEYRRRMRSQEGGQGTTISGIKFS
jgi:hypothetical protein